MTQDHPTLTHEAHMTLKVHVELSPEESAELRERVAIGDQPRIREMLARAVEPTVVALLTNGVEETKEPPSFETLADELIGFFDEIRSPNAPPLPAEALTREDLYRDRL